MRRRERQLRAWHRHVKMMVAMELATALHHSAQRQVPVVDEAGEGEVHEQYDAPRGPMPPLPGARPAPLSEVAGPQAAVTVGYVAAGAPSLTVV